MAIKILVIDDSISLTAILQQILVEEGFEVETAAGGQEGYLAYLINRPDVILTDIHMPGENGLELMKHIRMHDPGVRAMYMSGDRIGFQSTIEEEEREFCAKFLTKPFTREELMRLLSESLNLSGKEVPPGVQPSSRQS